MAADAFDREPEFTIGAKPSELAADADRKTAKSAPRARVAPWVALTAIVGAAACYLLWPRDAAVTRPAAPARVSFAIDREHAAGDPAPGGANRFAGSRGDERSTISAAR